MNFYVIVIIATCITLEGVRASVVRKTDEYADQILPMKFQNDKEERINLDKEVGNFWLKSWIISWLRNIPKRVAIWLGFTNYGVPSNSYNKIAFWPNGRIPYTITGNFDHFHRKIILSAIEEFHKHTCIRFVPRTNDKIYINIVSSYDGCSSNIGYIEESFDVYLEPSQCGSHKGNVLHELMHAIGFIHEQSRNDRDDHVIIKWENIKSGAEDNFKKYVDKNLNNFGWPYDFKSLMHYPEDAFSYNGQRTIIPRVDTSIKMGGRNTFSYYDIKKINRIYQCRR